MDKNFIIEISKAELGMIYDALGYAIEQVATSYIPVFKGVCGEDCTECDEDQAIASVQAANEIMEKIELLFTNDEGMLILNG